MRTSGTAPSPPPALGRPVQKFKPTTGPVIGYVGLAVCALVLGFVVTSEQHLTGLRAALGAVLVAVLIWVALLRPRAVAYDDSLVLRGLVSDTRLPLAHIDAAVVRHVLLVWVGEDRYTCAGFARSTRSMVKHRNAGGTSVLGMRQPDDRTVAVSGMVDIDTSGDYATFVETRIEELAKAARRDGKWGTAPHRRWAWPEIAALAVTALAFGVSLVLA